MTTFAAIVATKESGREKAARSGPAPVGDKPLSKSSATAREGKTYNGTGTTAPPTTAPTSADAEWRRVEGSKKRRKEAVKEANQVPPPSQRGKGTPPKKVKLAKSGEMEWAGKNCGPQAPVAIKRREPPRTAAVTINCPPGEYEKVLREVKTKIDLASLNIEGLRVRCTITGVLNYEVSGPEGGTKQGRCLGCQIKRGPNRATGGQSSSPGKNSRNPAVGSR